jgi:AraC-like DNA-binding protein
MDAGIERAVGLAIKSMRENLGEPLTVDDMARAARFSKFHFTRLFARVTGISPGRFLSALRMARAKHLLLSTTMNVTEIAHCVGYTSVGTFSTRFSSCVGVSPSTYRAVGGQAQQFEVASDEPDSQERCATVRGRISGSAEPGPVFVGLFPDRLPQGRPLSSTVLAQPGPYALRRVPRGSWYLLAHAASAQPAFAGPATDPRDRAEPGDLGGHIGSAGPVTVRSDADEWSLDVTLRPVNSLDPPFLLACRTCAQYRRQFCFRTESM